MARLASMTLALALAAITLGAWPIGAAAQEIRLAVSTGPVSLPIYVADAKGYFARQGLNVSLRECSSGKQCFQLLSQNEADVATAAELVMTLNNLAGSDAAIIATISSSVHHIKLVARGGIKAPADLRGRRVATIEGTSAHYFLDSWLVYHGIDPKAVSIVLLARDQLIGALQRKEVDALAIWEPVASGAIGAVGGDAQALPGARIYTQHFSLMAGRSVIAQRDGDLVRLLRALAGAERFIAEQPAQALKILNARLPGDAAAAHDIAEHHFRLALDQSLIATMDGQRRWALRERLVATGQGSGGLLRGIEPGLLRRALPGAVTLVP